VPKAKEERTGLEMSGDANPRHPTTVATLSDRDDVRSGGFLPLHPPEWRGRAPSSSTANSAASTRLDCRFRPSTSRATTSGPSLDRAEFEQVGADQSRLVITATFGPVEARDSMLQSGMEKGVNEGYEKLDELLARRDASG
jgi:hypothetical protein